MSFFSVFSEISKNKQTFQQWEQNKADQEAKREKYFAQNPPNPDELKKAKEFGRVIVDSVDFMDSQSENKSESVENAVEMTTGIASTVATIFSMRILGKNHAKNLNALSDNEKKIDSLLFDLNRKNTHPNVINDLKENRLTRISKFNGSEFIHLITNFDGIPKILEEKNYKKLSDETKEFFKDVITPDVINKAKKAQGGAKKTIFASALVGISIGAIGQIIGSTLQIKASRVARYQARESLKDTKNFVQYTDEQKEEAKKYLPNIDIPKEKKSGNIKDITSVMKDYDAYKAESDKLNNVHLYDIEEKNPQEAYKQQKVINSCIKKINNQAEEYSENMETAAATLLGCSVLGGAFFGKIVGTIAKKIEQAKAKNKSKKPPVENVNPGRLKKVLQELSKFAKNNPMIAGGLLSTIIMGPLATKLTKEASRAGRYQAKRELEENSQNFIYVENSELQKYDVQGEVKKDGFLDVFRFIPKAIKTMKEYNKYKKTTLRQKKAELEALKMTKISDEQLKSAKNLQTRLYKSFDVIDDHSQEYSEKMEAACEITKDIFNNIALPAAFLIPGIIIAKNPQKVAKPLTGILASTFKNFKGFTKKYAKNLGEHNINKFTQKAKNCWEYRELSFAEKDIDELLKTENKKAFEEKMKNLQGKLDEKLGKYSAERYAEQIRKFKSNDFSDIDGIKVWSSIQSKLSENSSIIESYKIQSKFDYLLEENNINKRFVELEQEELLQNKDIFIDSLKNESLPEKAKSEIINILENPDILKHKQTKKDESLQKDTLKEAIKFFANENDPKNLKELYGNAFPSIDFKKLSDKDILKIKDNIKTFAENIPEEEFIASINKINEFRQEKNLKTFILQNNSSIEIKPKDIFITKDLAPIAYSILGTYIAGMIGLSYSVESYMSSKTKQAGRLGTMKAIEELNQENDKSLETQKTA